MDSSRPVVIKTVPASDTLPAVKRQRRSPDLKRQIVEETLAPGASVARVARVHRVNANQVFQWRRQYGEGLLGIPGANATRLLPVCVSPVPADGTAPGEAADTNLAPTAAAEAAGPNSIHLELRKARLRIEGNVDPAVLRLVLKAVLG